MNNTNTTYYPVVHLGAANSLKSVNIVAIKKKHWRIDKPSIPNYLAQYDDSEIKLGKLISSIDDENIYELSSSGSPKYDIILFVINRFELGQSVSPSGFTAIGLLEIPEIGIDNPSTVEKISMSFLDIESPYKDEELNEIINVSINLDLQNYSIPVLGEKGYFKITDTKDFYSNILKPELSSDNDEAISFMPGGILYKNSYYAKPYISLQNSNFTNISSIEQIHHGQFEYVRFKDTLGNTILRNITIGGTGELLLATSPINVYVEKEAAIETLVNPDYIIITNLVNRVVSRIDLSVYITQGYNRVSDIPQGELTQINRKLIWGTDIEDTEVSTIFSDPESTIWFLQGKYRNIFKDLDFLIQDKVSYAVEKHNSKIFILKVLQKDSTRVLRKLAVDYKGNSIPIPDIYNLDIDGNLIVKLNESNYKGYKGDLSKDISITSVHDIYSLFPSGTEMIWSKRSIDLSTILICRDRFQEII